MNQAPEGRQKNCCRRFCRPSGACGFFIPPNPQLKLRAIFIRASGAGLQHPVSPLEFSGGVFVWGERMKICQPNQS